MPQHHALYICYFGLKQPLVQTQVLPYLRELSLLNNLKVSILTFEANLKTEWTDSKIDEERRKLSAENIIWYCLPYHKSPSVPATAYDILNGVKFILGLSRKEKIDILHARAHIPMLIVMLANKVLKAKTIFDIRGLMAEEYIDSGVWKPDSAPVKLIKAVERNGIKKASHIIVLTNKMRNYLVKNNLRKSDAIQVIPCCVDFSRVENDTENIKKNSRFEIIYAGSVTGLYLLREMGEFFLEVKKVKPSAFFRILTSCPPKFTYKVFQELGISMEDYSVSKVPSGDVPKYLKAANIGISFRSPTFSQIAASPTKIPEYLACGIPIVSNHGIGDTDSLLEKERVGVSLKNFDKEEIMRGCKDIFNLLAEEDISERCIKTAHRYFDLSTVGRNNYQGVYRKLLAKA